VKPLFTVHAGEFLVGCEIEKRFPRVYSCSGLVGVLLLIVVFLLLCLKEAAVRRVYRVCLGLGLPLLLPRRTLLGRKTTRPG
jgi:hypothetical protein